SDVASIGIPGFSSEEIILMQTIEIEIDASGRIHPIEPLDFTPSGRALLTLLDRPVVSRDAPLPGRAGDILALLASPRFANRPVASKEEVDRRIASLRNEWDDRP
ncbi:MAG: hypothetical protein Q8L56_15045, partial [Rhodocyclaceae bacterium]|nr:hypothetical protein [Rhodocyclaceae bacterium]